MLFNFDEPGFPIALLAILGGLRLAVYVAERLAGPVVTPATLPLAPDEPANVPPTPPAEMLTVQEANPDVGRAYDVSLETAREQQQVSARKENADTSRFLAELLDSGIIAVVLVFFIIRPFILQAFFIPSESMVPTLQTGDKLLATKYSYHLHEPQHRDVVVFQAPTLALSLLHQPDDPHHPTDYVKRVVGLPGDHIHIVANVGVYINNDLQHEAYLNALPDYDFPRTPDGSLAIRDKETRDQLGPYIEGPDLVVPPGYLFVLGDNRTQSHDGHIWGLLPRKNLLGKATFIFWPFNRIGIVH